MTIACKHARTSAEYRYPVPDVSACHVVASPSPAIFLITFESGLCRHKAPWQGRVEDSAPAGKAQHRIKYSDCSVFRNHMYPIIYDPYTGFTTWYVWVMPPPPPPAQDSASSSTNERRLLQNYHRIKSAIWPWDRSNTCIKMQWDYTSRGVQPHSIWVQFCQKVCASNKLVGGPLNNAANTEEHHYCKYIVGLLSLHVL